jgi:hypothetical protein
MRKGFGHYAPHEAVAFLLKAALVSLWVIAGVISALVVTTAPRERIAFDDPIVLAAFLVLVAGMVFSILLSWATGSLFAKPAASMPTGLIGDMLTHLKRSSHALLGTGLFAVAVATVVAGSWASGHKKISTAQEPKSCIDPIIARKCTEVARMENQLFQTDEQKTLAECFARYGKIENQALAQDGDRKSFPQ